MTHHSAWETDVRIRTRPGRPDSGVKLYVTDHGESGAQEFMANTRFFRYPALFDALAALLAAAETPGPLRVLIVPLSVGLEAASFVIGGLRRGLFEQRQVVVEGFDISAKATELARLAIYPRLFFPEDLAPFDGMLRELPDGFVAVEGAVMKHLRVLDSRDIFAFEAEEPYDMVICLNLLMHVAAEDRARLVGKLASLVAPEGVLCLNNNQEWPDELTPYFEAVTGDGGFASLHDELAGRQDAQDAQDADGRPAFAVTDANAMILRKAGA